MKNIKFFLVLAIASLLLSCEDFTKKNLDVASPTGKVSGNNLLLTQSGLINQGEFSLEKLIANTGLFIMAPLTRELKDNVESLSKSIGQHCAALDVFKSIDEAGLEKLRAPIQEDLKSSILTYQKLSMMNFGPSAEPTSSALNSIYSFDGRGKCRVDLQLLQLSLRDRLPRLDVINNYDVRGLDALEPLFFANPNTSRCDRTNPRLDAWFKKSLIEREKDVCRYSQHLLSDITLKAKELSHAWDPNLGHYTQKALSGNIGSPIEITNQLSQALFSLDIDIKDRKLAYPAGFEVRIDGQITKCPDASCPQASELPYSKLGIKSLIASIEGFKTLLNGISLNTGYNGFGLDDFLSTRDFSSISSQFNRDVDSLISRLQKLDSETTLTELLTGIDSDKCESSSSDERTVEACSLVWDIRKITNTLKNEYLVALQELNAPRQAQGDND